MQRAKQTWGIKAAVFGFAATSVVLLATVTEISITRHPEFSQPWGGAS